MKQNYRGLLAGLSLALALAGCADQVERITAPATGSPELRAEPDGLVDAERAALAKIGRLVATSLAEKSMRHQLKRDLRKAPFREHKLELGRYLRSDDGKELLARMAGGKSSDAVLTLVDQVRSLEFYMPVRKHRETWVGDGELLVAVQLEEEDPIIAFDGSGRERRLDPDVPPEQPTLSIVASETRFDQPMAASYMNVGDMGGRSIGTLEARSIEASRFVAVDEGGGGGSGGGGGAGTPIPPGLYLEFSRILDVHEPFTRGEPEIEVHIQGPSDPGNPRIGVDLSCSGQQVYDHRKFFNQDGGFWEGRVMLFSADEVARFNSQFQDGFHVLFWEDDDTACVLKLDNDALLEFLKATSIATSTVALKIVPLTWRLAATVFLATMFTNPGEWLKTNDDFIGAAVTQANAGYYYPNNTHVLMKGTTLNGRATLAYR